jgi:UDP-glucose 4-epimerase
MHRWNYPRSQFEEHVLRRDFVDVECDLSAGQSSIDQLEKVLRDSGAHTVIHLAGDGRPSADIHELVSANIVGTHTVLQAAANASCVKRVVFASSNHAFLGERMQSGKCGTVSHLQPLIRDEDVGVPDSLYGVSKVCGESLLRLFSTSKRSFEGIAMRIGWAQFDNPATALPKGASEHEVAYLRAIWLSRRDALGFFKAMLELPRFVDDKKFLSFWATSNNSRAVFDHSRTANAVGYEPRDDAELFFAR